MRPRRFHGATIWASTAPRSLHGSQSGLDSESDVSGSPDPLEYREDRYSWTHSFVLLHWPSAPFWARSLPRSAAALKEVTVTCLLTSATSGINESGPATAG